MTESTETRAATADSFRRLGGKLWGYGWQQRAARHFEVSDRTVRHWASGRNAVPERVMAEMRLMVSIAPPPDTDDEDDRDDVCREALEPAMSEIFRRAQAAGWHPAEIAVAILAMTVDQLTSMAGTAEARELLEQAVAQLGDEDG